MSVKLETQDASAKVLIGEPSVWQRDRIREALLNYREFKCNEEDEEFRPNTWAGVREAILEFTGAEIGANPKLGGERLRQFVQGVSKKNEPGVHYPLPQPFDAIVEFVTDPDLDLLTLEELKERHTGPQAALRLLEHFRIENKQQASIDAVRLAGDYIGYVDRPDYNAQHRLTLEYLSNTGLLLATETIEASHLEKANVPGIKGDNVDASFERNSGWAIPTPEDNLILLLKDQSSGDNITYFSVNDVGLWQRSNIDYNPVYFVRQRFGIPNPSSLKEVLQELRQDLFWFIPT